MPTKRKSKSSVTANRLFLADLALSEAGSVRVQFRPAPPLRSLYSHERKLAALIYDLAAELERRCEELGARWVVSPDLSRARIDVELGENDDPEPAAELVASVFSDMGLG